MIHNHIILPPRIARACMRTCVAIFACLIPDPRAAAQTGADPSNDARPMSIEEAVRRTLEKNYAISVARYGEPIAAANVSVARGAFDPQFNFSHESGRGEDPAWDDPVTGARPPGLVWKDNAYKASLGGLLPWGAQYTLSGASSNPRSAADGFAQNHGASAAVSFAQPLLRGFGSGGTIATLRIAQVDRTLSAWEFQKVVIDTVTSVVFACNELHYAQARLRSARRSRDLASQVYVENQKRFERSVMSEVDMISARASVANRESDILDAGQSVRDAENRLRAMISDAHTPALLDAPLRLAAPSPPVAVSVRLAEDFPRALALRPDYQSALLSVKRGEINLRRERNQALPRLDLVGSYGFGGAGASFGDSRRQIGDGSYPSYSAGVVLNVPLTFAAERGRVRGAKLNLQQAGEYVRALEQSIVVALGNAAGHVETAWKRVEACANARLLSAQTLDGELKRLRAGTGTTYVVLRQQEMVSSDEVREARAHADYRNALAEYDRQTGRTLERFHIELARAP